MHGIVDADYGFENDILFLAWTRHMCTQCNVKITKKLNVPQVYGDQIRTVELYIETVKTETNEI